MKNTLQLTYAHRDLHPSCSPPQNNRSRTWVHHSFLPKIGDLALELNTAPFLSYGFCTRPNFKKKVSGACSLEPVQQQPKAICRTSQCLPFWVPPNIHPVQKGNMFVYTTLHFGVCLEKAVSQPPHLDKNPETICGLHSVLSRSVHLVSLGSGCRQVPWAPRAENTMTSLLWLFTSSDTCVTPNTHSTKRTYYLTTLTSFA